MQRIIEAALFAPPIILSKVDVYFVDIVFYLPLITAFYHIVFTVTSFFKKQKQKELFFSLVRHIIYQVTVKGYDRLAQYSSSMGGSLQEMIDRYSRELMQFREKTEAMEENTQTQPQQAWSQELARLKEDFERLENQLEQIRQSAADLPQQGNGGVSDAADDEPSVSTDGIAQLKVVVYAADEAIPIQGANVIITSVGGQGEEIYQTAVTDENGRTPEFELPAVEVSGSNQQMDPNSYTEYRVSINADGYIPQDRIASLVATTSATLPVAMTPQEVFSRREML